MQGPSVLIDVMGFGTESSAIAWILKISSRGEDVAEGAITVQILSTYKAI